MPSYNYKNGGSKENKEELMKHLGLGGEESLEEILIYNAISSICSFNYHKNSEEIFHLIKETLNKVDDGLIEDIISSVKGPT